MAYESLEIDKVEYLVTDDDIKTLVLKSEAGDLVEVPIAPTSATIASLSDLASGTTWLAHRGFASIHPENTMEAFRNAVAMGATIIEMDCGLLADGTVACIHDDTIDRTTTGTGDPADLTAMEWRNLDVDAGSWHSPGWPDTMRHPMVADVFAEFGGKVIIMVEPKDADALGPLLDLVERYGLTDSFVLSTLSVTQTATAAARGIAAAYYQFVGSFNLSLYEDAIAAGAQYLVVDHRTTDENIESVVALGLPVWAFTIARRQLVTRLDALGVTGYFADESVYLMEDAVALRTEDSWGTGFWPHGLIPRAVRPTLEADGELSFLDDEDQYVVLGELCPIVATTYQVDMEFKFVTLPADMTRYVGLFFAGGDDSGWNPAVQRTTTGYHATLRANGDLAVYTYSPTVATQIGSTVAGADLVADTWYTLRINVTPTTVKATRVDTGGTTGDIANTAYRGGYLHAGKATAEAGDVRIRNIVVTV